jgi:hypothetical protein
MVKPVPVPTPIPIPVPPVPVEPPEPVPEPFDSKRFRKNKPRWEAPNFTPRSRRWQQIKKASGLKDSQ